MRPATNRRLLGVVLCGGRSTRMGRDKGLLPHPQGGTFLHHAVGRLQPVCGEVVISGTNRAGQGVEAIEDAVAHRGPAGGIAATLRHAVQQSFDACLVTPVDLPRLTTADLGSLVDVWEKNQRLVIGCSDQLEPLVGIYPTTLVDEIERLAASSQRSLLRWLSSQDYRSVSLPKTSCHNINCPRDLTHGT